MRNSKTLAECDRAKATKEAKNWEKKEKPSRTTGWDRLFLPQRPNVKAKADAAPAEKSKSERPKRGAVSSAPSVGNV